MRVIITGGSGFVGSHLTRFLLRETHADVINLDRAKPTTSLKREQTNTRYHFVRCDVCSQKNVEEMFFKYRPTIVFHLAASTRVDQSVLKPRDTIKNNLFSTIGVLDSTRNYYKKSSPDHFRVVHCSDTCVYGGNVGNKVFTEESPHNPTSPYASSASSTSIAARSWNKVFGIPTVVTHAPNLYGSFQDGSRLIPKTIGLALESQPVPLYGDGQYVKDWLHVDDYCRGLWAAAKHGKIGSVYNLGTNESWTNEQVVRMILSHLDDIIPRCGGHSDLVYFTGEKPGHDRRCSVDTKKSYTELLWLPQTRFVFGLRELVRWHVERKFSQLGIRRSA